MSHTRYNAHKKYSITYVYDGRRRIDSCFSKLEVNDFIKQLLNVNGKVSSITIYRWADPIANWERDLSLTMYCPLHDSFLDPTTDTWAEPPCSDPSCDFCVGRPSRPSECVHEVPHASMHAPGGWT